MNKKYDYLRQYQDQFGKRIEIWRTNSFHSINFEEILKAEKQIGFEFPQSLKEFWLEIGYGSLYENIKRIDAGNNNMII